MSRHFRRDDSVDELTCRGTSALCTPVEPLFFCQLDKRLGCRKIGEELALCAPHAKQQYNKPYPHDIHAPTRRKRLIV